MHVELKFATGFLTRHGQRVYYFRRGASPRVRLPGEPLSREFMEAYWAAMEAVPYAAPAILKISRKRSSIVCAPKAAAAQAKRTSKAAGSAIYFIQGQETQRIKIGFSADPVGRLKELATGCPERLTLLGAIGGTLQEEQALHRRFKSLHEKGEWFENGKPLTDFIDAQLADPDKVLVRNSWDAPSISVRP